MKPWHFRYARMLIGIGATVAAVSIVFSACWGESDFGHFLVNARQLFGLWALGLLLASILLGPLTSVLPWMPFKSSLMFGRRAVGIAALAFAGLHVAAYLWSVGRRHWNELYTPGILWLDALGNDLQAEVVREVDGRAHDRGVGVLCCHLEHERLVDLDHVDR